MYALQALRQVLSDLWHDSLLLVITGVLGGLLSLLLLPIPFVLAAHYQLMEGLAEQRAVTVGDWFRFARREWRFFTVWTLLALVVTSILFVSCVFYLQLGAAWSTLLGYLIAGLLFTWILPQPFVPAFYLQQTDRRLMVAWRNTAVLLAADPLSLPLLWLAVAFLALPLAYLAWPLLPALVPFIILISVRIVRRFVRNERQLDERTIDERSQL